jgi:hypothetical protein
MANWIPVVAALLGGGLLGNFWASYAGWAQERRAARAEVRRLLIAVERARVGTSAGGPGAHLAELQVTATVAGVPRAVMHIYGELVLLGSGVSNPVDPAMARLLGKLTDQAVDLMVFCLWHPQSSRWVRGGRVARLDKSVSQLR